MNLFGDRLRDLRNKRKLSIDELVSKLNEMYETNISKSMISRYENGEADPKMSNVRILADFFKVSADYLSGLDTIETIAAHHDGDDWSEDELAEIEKFKDYVRNKRNL